MYRMGSPEGFGNQEQAQNYEAVDNDYEMSPFAASVYETIKQNATMRSLYTRVLGTLKNPEAKPALVRKTFNDAMNTLAENIIRDEGYEYRMQLPTTPPTDTTISLHDQPMYHDGTGVFEPLSDILTDSIPPSTVNISEPYYAKDKIKAVLFELPEIRNAVARYLIHPFYYYFDKAHQARTTLIEEYQNAKPRTGRDLRRQTQKHGQTIDFIAYANPITGELLVDKPKYKFQYPADYNRALQDNAFAQRLFAIADIDYPTGEVIKKPIWKVVREWGKGLFGAGDVPTPGVTTIYMESLMPDPQLRRYIEQAAGRYFNDVVIVENSDDRTRQNATQELMNLGISPGADDNIHKNDPQIQQRFMNLYVKIMESNSKLPE